MVQGDPVANVVVVLLLGVCFVLGSIAQRRKNDRTRRFASFAARNGWRYAGADAKLTELSTHLLPGRTTGRHGQVVHDVLHETDTDVSAYSFTYRWSPRLDRREGKARIRKLVVQVVAVPLPVRLPMVQVTPEGAGSQFARAFGAQDVHVESDAFNRGYRVVTDDAQVAHGVVHPRLMEQLLTPEMRGISFRIDHGWVLVWADGQSELERIGPMRDWVMTIRRSLPAYLLADHGSAAIADR
jgi:hypothetical protein